MDHYPAEQLETEGFPMLVYDGSCGFCNRSVQFILRHERRHDLCFVQRDSELGKRLRHAHGMDAVESMLWIDRGNAFAQSHAVIKAAGYLGGVWTALSRLASIVPAVLLDGMYKFIANHRRRLVFGSQDAQSNAGLCPVPSAEQRSRFLG